MAVKINPPGGREGRAWGSPLLRQGRGSGEAGSFGFHRIFGEGACRPYGFDSAISDIIRINHEQQGGSLNEGIFISLDPLLSAGG